MSWMMRVTTAALVFVAAPAFAEETMGEKADVMKNDTKRAAKKGANRVKEAVCMESDAECLAKKAKHRTEETVDKAGDKAKEVKNNVD